MDDSGHVIFIILENGELSIQNEYSEETSIFVPPDKDDLPFLLPKASDVIHWDEKDNDKLLFEAVLAYFKRFSYLPDSSWLIVALVVFLSYLQDQAEIHYLPMILFCAVPERGKSRTGKAMVYIAFRGIHLVELREANLLRYTNNLNATLFFDMKNFWKKAERNNAENIILLRYEKGGKASRVLFPEKGAFNDMVHYNVFVSTIIATNEAVHKILDTRCIPIIMPNKPGNTYENPYPDKGLELKARLTAWRARTINKKFPDIEPPQFLTGRLWDITKPMLQIYKMIYPEKLDELLNALQAVARQRIEDKKDTIEGKFVNILNELSPDNEKHWEIPFTRFYERLLSEGIKQANGKELSPQQVGKKLKALGIEKRESSGDVFLKLDEDTLKMIITQYLYSEDDENIATNATDYQKNNYKSNTSDSGNGYEHTHNATEQPTDKSRNSGNSGDNDESVEDFDWKKV